MSKAKTIDGFESYYVTDSGDVYAKNYRKSGRIRKLTQCKNDNGYMCVVLSRNGKTFCKKVHRLVAIAFIKNPFNKREVNHKDGNRTNNNVSNLEWATGSENIKHSYEKLGRVGFFTGKKGKDCPNSKLVLQLKNGKEVGRFYGTLEASRKTGICQSNISGCCVGRYKTAGKYQWKYL